ncbi:MAG: hypothetical protein NWR96_10075 [Crocinitomicaceae bacterium]|jgi:hypothetical protein|nr:hypothetical protein [Crocinitomicaceae bacterium]MDP4761970.1 hypothetical protein [Crocinitomicaceae bacterium]
MKKIIGFLLLTLCSFSIFAQSKKDQIESLTFSLDSIQRILLTERQNTSTKMQKLDSIVAFQENVILKEKHQVDTLNLELRRLNLKILEVNQEKLIETSELIEKYNVKNKENLALMKELNSMKDSLHQERSRSNEKNDFLKEAVEITKASLYKPANATMNEIVDWLNQFTILSESQTIHYDLETARFYGGESASIEMLGKVTLKNTLFQEGIVFNERYEHEGSMYQLFIPVLEIQDVKRLIDRLCRNMGGCVSSDEMEVNYEKTDFGVKVSWGGGC